MTTLILVRHGQSSANINKTFAGHIDVPLTDLGLKQAEKTAEYIAENYKVDKIYSSDLSRALATGKALAEKLGMEVHTDKSLREIFAGEWEDNTFDYLQQNYSATYNVWLSDIGNAKSNGGESVAQLSERIVSAVCRIAEENDGKTVVIATHATPIRALQCAFEGKPVSEMKDVPWVSNSSVTVTEYSNKRFSLITAGYDKHLEDLRSSFPSNV